MATEWQNERGRSRWQPTLPDGYRLWRTRDSYGEGAPVWLPEDRWWTSGPFLCGKRRAERIERRRLRKEQREEMDEIYKEVDRGLPDDTRRVQRCPPV